MSDPTCEQEMNETLRNDDHLRALCLSEASQLNTYKCWLMLVLELSKLEAEDRTEF
jgi:hypothetical protein